MSSTATIGSPETSSYYKDEELRIYDYLDKMGVHPVDVTQYIKEL
jgi:hypothetical protein